MKSIHSRIKDLRIKKGYSQEYLGGRIGITQKAYSNLEAGNCKIPWARIVELSRILEVDIMYLAKDNIDKKVESIKDTGLSSIENEASMFTLMQQMIESLRAEINLLKKQNAQLLDLLSEKKSQTDRQTDRQTIKISTYNMPILIAS